MENQDSSEPTAKVDATNDAETLNQVNNGPIGDQVNGVDQSQMERSLIETINADDNSVASEDSVPASSQTQQTRQLISQREMANLQSANLPGLQELVGPVQLRRNRVNTSTLRTRFQVLLDALHERIPHLPKPGARTLAPDAVPRFKVTFTSFKFNVYSL